MRLSSAGGLSDVLGRLEAHEVEQARVETLALAGVEVDAVDLLHQALQALELLQAPEERVFLHEPCGVGASASPPSSPGGG